MDILAVVIFNINELITLIMQSLDLASLYSFSHTLAKNYICIHAYLCTKVGLLLMPFGLVYKEFMEELNWRNAFIIGSIALKAVAPESFLLETNNLNIIIITNIHNHHHQLHFLEEFLVKSSYSAKEPNYCPTTPTYTKPFTFCRSFT